MGSNFCSQGRKCLEIAIISRDHGLDSYSYRKRKKKERFWIAYIFALFMGKKLIWKFQDKYFFRIGEENPLLLSAWELQKWKLTRDFYTKVSHKSVAYFHQSSDLGTTRKIPQPAHFCHQGICRDRDFHIPLLTQVIIWISNLLLVSFLSAKYFKCFCKRGLPLYFFYFF